MFAYRYLLLAIILLAVIGAGVWLAISHVKEKGRWFWGPILGAGVAVALLAFVIYDWRRTANLQSSAATSFCSELIQAQSRYSQSKDIDTWSKQLDTFRDQRDHLIATNQVDGNVVNRCWTNVLGTFVRPSPTPTI